MPIPYIIVICIVAVFFIASLIWFAIDIAYDDYSYIMGNSKYPRINIILQFLITIFTWICIFISWYYFEHIEEPMGIFISILFVIGSLLNVFFIGTLGFGFILWLGISLGQIGQMILMVTNPKTLSMELKELFERQKQELENKIYPGGEHLEYESVARLQLNKPIKPK